MCLLVVAEIVNVSWVGSLVLCVRMRCQWSGSQGGDAKMVGLLFGSCPCVLEFAIAITLTRLNCTEGCGNVDFNVHTSSAQ